MPDAVLTPLLEERSWSNSVSVIVVEECWPTLPKVHWSFYLITLLFSVQSSFFQKETVCLALLFYSCAAACCLWRGENFSWKQMSRSPSVFVFNWDVAPWCLQFLSLHHLTLEICTTVIYTVLSWTLHGLTWGGFWDIHSWEYCDIVLTHLEAPDKTSAFIEVLQPAEHQLIRCIWLAAPGC